MVVTNPLESQEAEELRRVALKHMFCHEQGWAPMGETGLPVIFIGGKGIHLTDSLGNDWIDANAGYQLVNIGYGRTEVADAAYEQMKQLAYFSNYAATEPAVRLCQKLAEITPGDLSRSFLVSGGSDSVETAIKMARAYHRRMGDPGRYRLISKKGSYHGAWGISMWLGSHGAAEWQDYEPAPPGLLYAPQPNGYRDEFGSASADESAERCANAMEQLILYHGANTVAAVVVDPVTLFAEPPAPSYFPRVREICDKYGVIMIMDEVITGFGRTGRWFASEHWDVVPDIMTVAKGLSSGYLPIGAAIASENVAEKFAGGEHNRMFGHAISFGGHAVTAMAALKNIEILETDCLVENSAAVGAYFLEQLEVLKSEHSIIGSVWGMGLQLGVELVKDRDSKEPFPEEAKLLDRFKEAWHDVKLNMRLNASGFPICPPLCITKDEVDDVVDKLGYGVRKVSEQLGID